MLAAHHSKDIAPGSQLEYKGSDGVGNMGVPASAAHTVVAVVVVAAAVDVDVAGRWFPVRGK